MDNRLTLANCGACPAARDGKPGPKCTPAAHRPADARLVVVSEVPSKKDETARELMAGDYSGQLLWSYLAQAGFRRNEVWVTAAALCRPARAKEIPVAAYACAPRLAAELAELPPETPIVPLGTVAESVLTGHANIAKGRGFVWRVPAWEKSSRPKRAGRPQLLWDCKHAIRTQLANRVVFPTLDPRQAISKQQTWLPLIGRDLKRVRRWLDGAHAKPLDDEGTEVVCRTSAELAIELADWNPRGAFGLEVVVDVETAGKDPMTTQLQMVGFCDVATGRVVQAYPWRADMAPTLNAFLKDRVVVTHNGPSFDEIVLERHGVTYANRADTLVMHHAFASHLRQSLDHCVSNYCDSAPWKLRYRGQTQTEKGGFGVSAEDLSAYNGADVRLDALVYRRMPRDMGPEDRKVYELDMRLADVARRMRLRGMAIDEPRRAALIEACRRREETLLETLRAVVGDAAFNPSQAKAVRSVLYKNLPAKRKTLTGEQATDRGALEEIAKLGGTEGRVAKLVLAWRKARDARTEYLEALQPLAGRVHPGWRMPSTETGRPACKEPNFLNMPRVPHCKACGIALIDGASHRANCAVPDEILPEGQIRDIYIAAPGHTFVYFDLSQAEMRFAAHIYNDPRMVDACGSDVHVGNACVCFPEHAEIIRADPKGRGKPYRDIAKNVGFAIAYLARAQTVHAYLLAHEFDVTYQTVEAMLEKLHGAYKHYYAWVDYNVRLVKTRGYMRSVWSGRKRTLGKIRVNSAEVANYLIQAGVADIMNSAILHFDEVMGADTHLVMYAYDALVYETRKGPCAEQCARIIREYWERPIRVPAGPQTGHKVVEFVQPIDIHMGDRLSGL